jgi:hypothetical protein
MRSSLINKGLTPSLSTLVNVKGAQEWRTLRALVDSGTTENLISHLVAKEIGGKWEPTFATAKGVGNQEIQLFGRAQPQLDIAPGEVTTATLDSCHCGSEYVLLFTTQWSICTLSTRCLDG